METLSICLFFSFAFGPALAVEPACGQTNTDGKGYIPESQWSPNSRIIGGRDAKPGEVPWIADLTIIIDEKSRALCGGAIVDKYTIMTAGHCLYACPNFIVPSFFAPFMCPNYRVPSFKVCVGVLDKKEADGAQCFETDNFQAHENYACCSNDNSKDIAIIKIKEGIDLPKFTNDGSNSVNPICLPPADEATTDYSGKGIIAGFGVTDPNSGTIATTLQIGTVNLISTTECQQTYGPNNVDNTQVCAYSDETSSCNGDSGSALYMEDENGIMTAVGLTSFGKINCQKTPVVYTKVAAYRDFIDQHSALNDL